MARSPKKLRRLVEIFRGLETIERARVGELTREMAQLRAAQDNILKRLENPFALDDPFLGLLSGRVGSLEQRLQRLGQERELALKRYGEASARRRSAAELFAEARGEEERQNERNELEALLEFQDASAAQGRCKSPGST